jgi:flagellum-specific peptidoglycan hydrolase FlgJ
MVAFTRLSPNHSGQRVHSIDRITPHCVVGQCTAEGLGEWFAAKSTQASSNYGIDRDGRVGLYVEEKNRSWCSSSNANDQRAITIECASDAAEPYAFRDVVYQRLIELCTDICKRNGKTKLLWFGDKDYTLNYEPKPGEMILTVHRWFANKSCPGSWMYARMGDLANRVTAALGGSADKPSAGMQASSLKGLSESDAIKKVGALFTDNMAKTGILASVSLAQFILESGYGSSELAQNANNLFGMKKILSGNNWSGSAWDGKSVYTKQTKEQNPDGSFVTITADFRKYPCVEDSIADHSAYLLGAMNGSKQRYSGLKGCADYKKAAQIIKDGGYATSLTYVSKLCEIIERWNLTQYDVKETATTATEQKTEDKAVLSSTHSKYINSTGAHYISNSGSDENGAYSGGQAGDQTGKEWRMRDWYSRPWTCVLRYPDQKVALKLAQLAIDAALNDHVGYDQSQNRTYLTQLKAVGWEPSKITVNCEADCSAGVCANVTAAGYLLGIKALQNHTGTYTGNMRLALTKAGFQLLTDSKYLTSGDYLLPGDILLNDGHHTATNVTIGKKVKADWKPGTIVPVAPDEPAPTKYYRVRKSWAEKSSQIGAFTVFQNAKNCVDANPGYTAFDDNGNQVYPAVQTTFTPYLVKVSIIDLNIRTGPGTNYPRTGKYTGKGVFTIVDTATGQGSDTGWGKLKSGAGWISLDYCQKI